MRVMDFKGADGVDAEHGAMRVTGTCTSIVNHPLLSIADTHVFVALCLGWMGRQRHCHGDYPVTPPPPPPPPPPDAAVER